ncbi:MAG: FlaD/FlaE family flagellar protein [Haloarculaceae archaeon]
MSINPRDYDLDELRKMARERGGQTGDGDVNLDDGEVGFGTVGTGEDVPAGNSFRAGLYRELLPLEAGSDASKPYLAGLPEHYAGEHLVFEWLEFLLLHAGYQGASEALDYYEAVGWITEDVESDLNDYLLGIDDQGANDGNELDIDDHLLSLVYVAKLASMR